MKLLARKRTYIGFGAFVLLEAVLVWFFQREKPREWIARMAERAGGGVIDDVFSALTMGFLVLSFSVFLLGAIYVALVSGDIVAKEAEDGTLRMVLARPVSRFRVLFIKWLACLLYTMALIFFIGTTSFLVGVILRGWGGSFLVMAPDQHLLVIYDWGEGLRRYFTGLFFLSLSMCVVASVGFLFSCLKVKPAAATILTLTVLFADFVLNKMPPLEAYRRYFLTSKLDAWVEVLREHPPIPTLIRDYAYLGGVAATCFVIAWLIFQSRDFKT